MLAILLLDRLPGPRRGRGHPRAPRALSGDLAHPVPAACRVLGFPRSARSLAAAAASILRVGDGRFADPGVPTDGQRMEPRFRELPVCSQDCKNLAASGVWPPPRAHASPLGGWASGRLRLLVVQCRENPSRHDWLEQSSLYCRPLRVVNGDLSPKSPFHSSPLLARNLAKAARRPSRSKRRSRRCTNAAVAASMPSAKGRPIPSPRLPRPRLSGCIAAPPKRRIAK